MSENDRMNIVEFLEARIDEDEARASSGWARLGDTRWETDNYGRDFLTPSSVLAECATKRSIIESYQNVSKASKATNALDTKLTISGMEEGLRIAVVSLTFPYKDHADWRREWVL